MASPGGRAASAAFNFPESRDAETRARLLQQFPDARETPPPADVQPAIDAIVDPTPWRAQRSVEHQARSESRAAFHRRVYDVARTIPPGATLTYGRSPSVSASAARRARSGKRSG